MYLILTGSLVLIFLTWFVGYIRRQEAIFSRLVNIKTGARMPGTSFFQSVYSVLIESKKIGSAQQTLNLHKKYGDFYRMTLFETVVTTADPEAIKQILRKIEEYPKQDTGKFMMFSSMFGIRNIISLNPPDWHNTRSLINKAFTSNQQFFRPMQKKVHQCISLWGNGKTAQVGYDIQKMTLDVLATCTFGQDFDTLHGQNAGPLAAYNYCLPHIFSPVSFLIPWYTKLPLPSNFKLKEKLKEFDTHMWNIIKEGKKNKSTNKDESKSDDSKNPYLLELMIDGGMSDQDIRDNVAIFFLAGHESTSSALSWAIAELAANPEVQKKSSKRGFREDTQKWIGLRVNQESRLY